LFITGINDSMLISRAIHVMSQLFLDMAIKELEIIMVYIRVENGDQLVNIKT